MCLKLYRKREITLRVTGKKILNIECQLLIKPLEKIKTWRTHKNTIDDLCFLQYESPCTPRSIPRWCPKDSQLPSAEALVFLALFCLLGLAEVFFLSWNLNQICRQVCLGNINFRLSLSIQRRTKKFRNGVKYQQNA